MKQSKFSWKALLNNDRIKNPEEKRLYKVLYTALLISLKHHKELLSRLVEPEDHIKPKKLRCIDDLQNYYESVSKNAFSKLETQLNNLELKHRSSFTAPILKYLCECTARLFCTHNFIVDEFAGGVYVKFILTFCLELRAKNASMIYGVCQIDVPFTVFILLPSASTPQDISKELNISLWCGIHPSNSGIWVLSRRAPDERVKTYQLVVDWVGTKLDKYKLARLRDPYYANLHFIRRIPGYADHIILEKPTNRGVITLLFKHLFAEYIVEFMRSAQSWPLWNDLRS